MKNIIYCRVSNMKKESYSFMVQEAMCTEYCKTNNLTIKQIHKEHNSGYGHQKILQNLILLNKNINLIIYDITRFSRSVNYSLILLKICKKHNINLHFVKENLKYSSTSESNSVLEEGLINSEMEWNQIRKRIISSIKIRRANNLVLGHVPFGFSCVNKKLIKNNNFNAIRLIVELRKGIKKCSEIRNILKTLSDNYETLNFYDENDNIIEQFSKPFTLDFGTIRDILNDYNICNKIWTNECIRRLYKKYNDNCDSEITQLETNVNSMDIS